MNQGSTLNMTILKGLRFKDDQSLGLRVWAWIAVKELRLSHHTGYQYSIKNRVSPI